MNDYEVYLHHNLPMWVREDLKGRHREHCLCYGCQRFFPEDRARNCVIACTVKNLCEKLEVTTPVWECTRFIPKEIRSDQDGDQDGG
jgi:N-acyl-L-homoserine lactone synthetase